MDEVFKFKDNGDIEVTFDKFDADILLDIYEEAKSTLSAKNIKLVESIMKPFCDKNKKKVSFCMKGDDLNVNI